MILQELENARRLGNIPADEQDYIIGGDFNANRFHPHHKEGFWDLFESLGWDILRDDDDSYTATRLTNNPPELKWSRIDYIITKGLSGQESVTDELTIYDDLFGLDPMDYRLEYSDHLLISFKVKIQSDDD